MNKKVVAVLSLLAIALILAFGSSLIGSGAHAQSPAVEVVVLRCAISAPVSSIPIVHSSNGSANAPEIRRGTTCAQGLATLIGLGFEIQAVEAAGVDNVETDLYYTLVSRSP